MKLPRITALGLPVLVGLLAVSAAGCLFSPDKQSPGGEPTPSNYKPQTSAANVLDNLRTAYEERKLEEYTKLFDPIEFSFRFDPVDLRDQPDLPAFWSWTEEEAVHRKMFDSEDVIDISLTFIKGQVQDVDEGDGEQIDLSWKKMTITGVQLEVETKNPDDPTDNIIYKVNGDRALYFFKEYPDEQVPDANGVMKPLWRITEWRDIRIGARPEGPIS